MLALYGRAGLMTALKCVFLLFNVEMSEINKIKQTREMNMLCFLASHSLSVPCWSCFSSGSNCFSCFELWKRIVEVCW